MASDVISYTSTSLVLTRVTYYTPSIINYAPRVTHEIVASPTIVIYDRNWFKVQTTGVTDILGKDLKFLGSLLSWTVCKLKHPKIKNPKF